MLRRRAGGSALWYHGDKANMCQEGDDTGVRGPKNP